MLLATLLSASTLFGAEVDAVKTEVIEYTKAQLTEAKSEAAKAKQETAKAKEDLANAIAEKAQMEAMMTSEAQATVAEEVLRENSTVHISVVGQGVAPMNTTSPAQAYALAKRAAIADGYRAIAEKVKGVRIDGQDLIKNMMVKRSTIRTSVKAMVRNANVVETTFKEGLCEVEMEIVISHSDFAQ